MRVFNRIAGLPASTRKHHRRLAGNPAAQVRLFYASNYWHWRTVGDAIETLLALLLSIPAVLVLAALFVAKNGRRVAALVQRPIHRQFADQLRLYFTAGVLPPWYYIYELYRRPTRHHARGFISRAESKAGVMALLKKRTPPRSVVSDKVVFAEECRRAGLRSIPVIGVIAGGKANWLTRRVRGADWFVKPVDGKGGKGIERWRRAGHKIRENGDLLLSDDEVIARLEWRSLDQSLLVQPRIANHPALDDLNNGALATIRALTCLNEEGAPELVGAVLRMAIGQNSVVDNVHAGGIVAHIDLASGKLGKASDLGTDVRLGWLTHHPISGAPIAGRRLPMWRRIEPFCRSAHAAFADRIIIGWDIAITRDGPVIVEANGAPDLDIMQRPVGEGLLRGRLGELLAHHLLHRVPKAA